MPATTVMLNFLHEYKEGGFLLGKRQDGIYTTHGAKKLICRNGRVDGKPALVWSKEGQAPAYILVSEMEELIKKAPYMEICTVDYK